MHRGFGVSTQIGEPVSSIVQQTRQSLPSDVTLHPGFQTNRNYDWRRAGINPLTQYFGIKSTGNIDHLNAMFEPDHTTHIVSTAVDRADHSSIVPEPDPLDPKPQILARTMLASELNPKKDPAALPPAGVCSQTGEFTIGDAIAGMGTMGIIDRDYRRIQRKGGMIESMTHGIPTKTNPFQNPITGPARYAELGLSDEDFLLLRDRAHVVPIMVKALGLEEDKAGTVFDRVARRLGRETISLSEFYDDFRDGSG
jgi:hypothetical protein